MSWQRVGMKEKEFWEMEGSFIHRNWHTNNYAVFN